MRRIDDWFKKMYGAYYDGGYVGDYVVDTSLPETYKFEDTSYTGRTGKLLYTVSDRPKDAPKINGPAEYGTLRKKTIIFQSRVLQMSRLKMQQPSKEVKYVYSVSC